MVDGEWWMVDGGWWMVDGWKTGKLRRWKNGWMEDWGIGWPYRRYCNSILKFKIYNFQ